IGLTDGRRVVFKYAKEPFTREDAALLFAADNGIPVPRLLASTSRGRMLGMILEDLGEPVREADDTDGAEAAVAAHGAKSAEFLPVIDRETLIGLPGKALASLGELRNKDRWLRTTDLDAQLAEIATVADRRSEGCGLPPYGLCHSEFHPTSLHVGRKGWRLLDWARAFTGPGLLDLASWQGTTAPADLDSLRRFIRAYVDAGGPAEAEATRGGLSSETWAMGWHRLWIVAWYLEQATTWINDPSTDPHVESVVRRHIKEAHACLTSAQH
nr:phosphotransferase [Micromonospora sp. DSM 115978]